MSRTSGASGPVGGGQGSRFSLIGYVCNYCSLHRPASSTISQGISERHSLRCVNGHIAGSRACREAHLGISTIEVRFGLMTEWSDAAVSAKQCKAGGVVRALYQLLGFQEQELLLLHILLNFPLFWKTNVSPEYSRSLDIQISFANTSWIVY